MGATVFYESASELATLSNTFSVAGVATDPTAVTLAVTSPSGLANTYTWPTPNTLNKPSTGAFNKDVACSEDGEWSYTWTGTGAAQDVVAGTWTVYEAELGKLYCTPQALKSRLGITDSADDYEVHAACFAASRQVEHLCERHFWRTAAGTVRTFDSRSMYTLKLPEYNDLIAATALKTDASGDGVYEVTWLASDYQLLTEDGTPNVDAGPEARPYTRIKAVGTQLFPYLYSVPLSRSDRIQITGTWGWPAIPWGIRMAALILAEETLKLKEAPFGIAGYGDMGTIRVRENPKVRSFAGPYMRNPADERGRKLFVA